MKRRCFDRRNWLGIGALIACLVATAATSPFVVSNPRSYPLWALTDATTTVGATQLTAWVSKSGKSGAGVTLSGLRCGDRQPTLRVVKARFEVEGLDPVVAGPAREVVPAPPAPASQPASQPASKPSKGPAQPPPPPPPVPPAFRQRLFYVAFPFDNEQAWNDHHNQGRLVLQLEVEGKPHTWTVKAQQSRKGFHRSAAINDPLECPLASASHCPAPASAPAAAPSSAPVLEPVSPDGGVR